MRFTISPVRIGRLPNVNRRGFTFTEVLFAVMLLGIGFIMVAAIFPVAIQQSQANRDDTNGIIVAKAGAKIMQSVTFNDFELMPGTSFPYPYDIDKYQYVGGPLIGGWGIVRPFNDLNTYVGSVPAAKYTLFDKIKGNLINKSDPRYAWVPLGYKMCRPMFYEDPGYPPPGKPTYASYEVYLVAVACRNKATYDESAIKVKGSNRSSFTFQPKLVCFRLTDGDSGPDLIEFSRPVSRPQMRPNFSAYDEPAAAEGAFVLVANDWYPSDHIRARQANGRFYRLGVKRPDLGMGVWELMPGYDMASDWENIPPVGSKKNPATGFMVGRGYVDPADPAAGDPTKRNASMFEGAAQDLFAMPVTVDVDWQ
ncbi:MAG: type IV pilus modification PilV family protein [Bacillota bacterium]